MRIAVVGAGGVGGFLAVMLARAGNDVWVLARGAHLDVIRAHGLRLHSAQFGDVTVELRASDRPEDLPSAELAFIGVKLYDFEPAAKALGAVLAANGAGVTLQNGLEAPALLAQTIGEQRVLIGTVSIEATVLEPGVIGHLVPVHQMSLSNLHGPPTARLESTVALLQSAQVNVSVAPDGRQALWDKAAALIPIATITAAAATGIGPIFELQETRALLQSLMDEAKRVAAADGHSVEQSQARFMALMEQAAEVRPRFTTSMDRDFQAGRRTELDWLTGALIRIAEEKHIDVPAHRALYAVLKLKQQRAAATSGELIGAAS
jgi:2-dehydropantoate 2-reductase